MIGVFDSGLGGLTIFKGILRELPDYDYIYLGDNARVPYGSRSSDIIYEYTRQMVDYLFQQGCQLVILACNTASSVALHRLQREYLPDNYPQRRILGVLRPAVEAAAEMSFNNRVGIIGTEATVNSRAFPQEFAKLRPDYKIFQQACPLLVPIIEAGELEWDGLDSILDKYLSPLKKKNIGALILGCTHYSLIKNKIQQHIGKSVRLIAEDEIVPLKLKDYLWRHSEIEKKISRNKKRVFLSTASSQRFSDLTEMFLGEPVKFKLIKTGE